MMRPVRRAQEETGASSVELLVYFPLLMLIILMAIQTALSWYGREVAITTARETARQVRTGSVAPAALAAAEIEGAEYARQTGAGGLTDVVVDVSVHGDEVTVTVSGNSMDIVGGLAPRVRTTVTSPIEEFKEDV